MGAESPVRFPLREFIGFRISYCLDEFPLSIQRNSNIRNIMTDTTASVVTATSIGLLTAQAKKVDETYEADIAARLKQRFEEEQAKRQFRAQGKEKRSLEKRISRELQPEVTERLAQARLTRYPREQIRLAGICREIVEGLIQDAAKKKRWRTHLRQ